MKTTKQVSIPMGMIESLRFLVGEDGHGGTIDDYRQDLLEAHMKLNILASAPGEYDLTPEVTATLKSAMTVITSLYIAFEDIRNERDELVRRLNFDVTKL